MNITADTKKNGTSVLDIPIAFNLFGQLITVEKHSDLVVRTDADGEAHYRLNKIFLDEALPKDKMEQIFLHEVLHFIFTFIGEASFSKDERLVNLVSLCLHQVLRTAMYPIDGKF